MHSPTTILGPSAAGCRHGSRIPFLALLAIPLLGCAPDAGELESSRPRATSWFVDRTRAFGIDFTYESGATGKLYLPEVMGAGVGLFDADGDGDLDLCLVNGNQDPVAGLARGSCVNRLFANPMRRIDGLGGGLAAGSPFEDVTASSGLGDDGYGMGLAVGDIDNDGDLDVLFTSFAAARLYRNEGAGHFRIAGPESGVEVSGWCCSAVFLDYDRDGYLDLYVTRYVAFDPKTECRSNDGRVDYCSPKAFEPVSDVLLHNERDGTFRDVSRPSGIAAVRAPGLGVVAADLDDDGWIDIYVANDGAANQLWINQRDGTFRDLAFQTGTALDLSGRAAAGMGVAVADLDGDQTLDLYVTHLKNEGNTLYLNRGGGRGFYDATGRSGMATSSVPYTGFGVAALDVELDGDLDLIAVGGRVTQGEPCAGSIPPPPWDRLAEPNLFYRNEGQGRFTLQTPIAGELGTSVQVSRGLAVGDLDADGDLDVVVNCIESPARVFLNEAPRAGRWLLVRAFDPRLNRDALGARVIVEAGGRRFLRLIDTSSSYLSSSDPRAHFGLGAVDVVGRVEIRWPDGLREAFQVSCIDCSVELRRGEGRELE